MTKAPIATAKWEKPDAHAIQALERGEASPEEQQRAFKWIIYEACQFYEVEMNPESERLSAIFAGRRFVGSQIIKLLKINLSKLKEKE